MRLYLGLLALCAATASAQYDSFDGDFLPVAIWGNKSTTPFEVAISPRDIFARQSCGQGYGRCRMCLHLYIMRHTN